MSIRESTRYLLSRYGRALSLAWRARAELAPPVLQRAESEFLPAALALRDTPVHPAPRVIGVVIVTLLTAATLWASFGKIDMVATAPGKVAPTGEVKTIQPEDTGVIAAIHVKDGQHVNKGDVLVDMDETDAKADASRSQSDLAATRAELARAKAMLSAIDGHGKPTLKAEDAASSSEAEGQVLEGEYADYLSNLAKMQADITQSQASLRQTGDEVTKLNTILPIERQKEADYGELVVKGFVGRHDYYNEQQAVIQLEQDLATQRDKQQELRAAIDAAQRKRDAYIDDTRKAWLEKMHDDSQKEQEIEQDLAKATQHRRLMHLSAPVAGTVQQLAVHTVGGVATSAQSLMTIVPDGPTLMVQAIIDNQDIGFVREGQPAEIKIETFPFGRYGTVHGTIREVSNDAKQDDKLGLIFTAEVQLARDTMQVDGRTIHLTPGMAVTTEIKTGRRRIISYLLSPLAEHVSDSFRER